MRTSTLNDEVEPVRMPSRTPSYTTIVCPHGTRCSDTSTLRCRRWTLNWDPVLDNVLVGSCPRSAEDVVRTINSIGSQLASANWSSDVTFTSHC